jgi:hypothetical protein
LGLYATIESHQLKRDMAYRWMAMSHAPREAVEAYIDTKENSGWPLKRSEVLEIGQAYRPPEFPLK